MCVVEIWTKRTEQISVLIAGHLPVPMTPEQMQAWTLQRELDERNRPMTDDEIETLLPDGYKVNKFLITAQGEIKVAFDFFSRHLQTFLVLFWANNKGLKPSNL